MTSDIAEVIHRKGLHMHWRKTIRNNNKNNHYIREYSSATQHIYNYIASRSHFIHGHINININTYALPRKNNYIYERNAVNNQFGKLNKKKHFY